MILTIKKFIVNKDNDYENMTSRVGQMRIFLDHIIAGNVPNEKYSSDSLLSYCRSLIEGQRGAEEGLEAGSWSVSPAPAEVDEDDRVDYHFFPTYLALSLLVLCGGKDPRVRELPGYEEALKKGFAFAVSRNLEGYGFNSFFQQIEGVLILGSGGCASWLKDHPDVSPEMTDCLKSLAADYKNRLETNDTVLAFGGDYREQLNLACKYMSPLSQ